MTRGYHQHKYQNTVLGYLKAGNGPEPLLLFHGFGQDHSAFEPIIDRLGDIFTFYSFDLFYHGQSTWPFGDKPLSKDQWGDMLQSFLKENDIHNFSLMGFSLGGKFVLAALEAFPSRVSSLYLLAPDGINTNFWYSLATYPIALRPLFKTMIKKPARFRAVVSLARSLHLADSGLIRFAQSQMATEVQRQRVYHSWVVFSRLRFHLPSVAALVNAHQIKLHIIVGKFDKVITAKNMNRLLSKVNDHHMYAIEAGHNNLIALSVEVLRNIALKIP